MKVLLSLVTKSRAFIERTIRMSKNLPLLDVKSDKLEYQMRNVLVIAIFGFFCNFLLKKVQ